MFDQACHWLARRLGIERRTNPQANTFGLVERFRSLEGEDARATAELAHELEQGTLERTLLDVRGSKDRPDA